MLFALRFAPRQIARKTRFENQFRPVMAPGELLQALESRVTSSAAADLRRLTTTCTGMMTAEQSVTVTASVTPSGFWTLNLEPSRHRDRVFVRICTY